MIGDDTEKDERPQVMGLLVNVRPHPKFPETTIYEIVQRDGSSLQVKGCGSLDAKLDRTCVGAFVKLSWVGWESGPRGDYRKIRVSVDNEPTAAMMAWPKWRELHPDAPVGAAITESLDDVPAALDEDDDEGLPF